MSSISKAVRILRILNNVHALVLNVLMMYVLMFDIINVYLQVFEYGTVIKDAVDIHYPVNEMICNSKIRYRIHEYFFCSFVYDVLLI